MLGNLFGGKVIESAVDGGVRYGEAREETKQVKLSEAGQTARSEHQVTQNFNAGSAFWRPFWMFSTITCVVLYVVYSIHFYHEWIDGLKSGKEWGLAAGFVEWKSGWIALGASLFSLATISFLGYSPFRSIEKSAKAITGTGIGEALRKRLPKRSVIVEREELEPVGEITEGIDGVSYRRESMAAPVALFGSRETEPANVSRNYFSRSELECRGPLCNCEFPGMHPVVLAMANDIREHFGRPVTVTSAYRCPEHNASIPGAAKNSFHVKAMAMDIKIHGVEPRVIYDYLINKYPRQYGFGLYNTFVHIDCRDIGFARKAGPKLKWRWFNKN